MCNQSTPFLEGEHFSCMDPEHQSILERLHQTLPYDPRAQIFIDAHLPCVFLFDPVIRQAYPTLTCRQLILSPADAPQVGNLPDICFIIRSVFLANVDTGAASARGVGRSGRRSTRRMDVTSEGVGSHTGAAALLNELVSACFPWGKLQGSHAEGKRERANDTHKRSLDPHAAVILVNILMGCLMGLYPSCRRHPVFTCRCELYKRIHCLLTSPQTTLGLFVSTHKALLQLATLEYVYHMLNTHMPAENEFVCSVIATGSPFEGCTEILDTFRRGIVSSGHESWEEYNAGAQKALDQCLRTISTNTRSDSAANEKGGTRVLARTPRQRDAWVKTALDSPCIHLCPPPDDAQHDEGTSQMPSLDFVRSVQRVVLVDQLPEELANIQAEHISRVANTCTRRALYQTTKFVCYACELAGRAASFRTDAETLQVTCSNGCQGCLIGVNATGNILTVAGRKYVFSPQCERVVEYDEEHAAAMWTNPPAVSSGLTASTSRSSKAIRYTCKYCSTPSKTLTPYEYPSLKTRRMVYTYLCRKHTPNEPLTRYVHNQEDFEAVCDTWVEQLKPWYRRVKERRPR